MTKYILGQRPSRDDKAMPEQKREMYIYSQEIARKSVDSL